MRSDLLGHAATARQEAAQRGTTAKMQTLEAILDHTVATVAVSVLVALRMATGDKYRSVYEAVERGDREVSEARYEAHRTAVDAKLYTAYHRHIVCAALSPDGESLRNYGVVTLVLDDLAIRERASVMRENAFAFYERFTLGARNAVEDPGWRATWDDRKELGVAHLGPDITPADSNAALAQRILFNGPDRAADRFMEVNIYGGIGIQAVGRVTLTGTVASDDDRDWWECAASSLRRRGIPVSGSALP